MLLGIIGLFQTLILTESYSSKIMKVFKRVAYAIKWFLYQEQSRDNQILWFIWDVITTFFM